MDIGKERPAITVEPLRDPFEQQPEKVERPEPEPKPVPDKEPARG